MPDSAGRDEFLLVALAQNGDRHAWEALLRQMHRPLRKYVSQMIGCSDVDDVLQDIALSIFKNLHHLRHPAAFRGWAFRIASRHAIRHSKREARWKRVAADPDTIGAVPAPGLPPKEIDTSLPELVEQISPASRAVMLLRYQQQLSLEEIAVALEIPLGTVKSRLSYGVSVLRKLFDQKGTS